jgi:CRP-like cAMP-binding protein
MADVLPAPSASGPKDRSPAQNILNRIAIFASLSASERQAIGDKMSRHAFEEGALVCEEGQPGDSLFLVEAGVVSVSRRDESGMGEEIARLGPGDFFGTNAAHKGAPRNVTVRALGPLTVCELRREDIAPVVWDHPDMQGRVNTLAKRLSPERMAPGDVRLEERSRSGFHMIDQLVRLFKDR